LLSASQSPGSPGTYSRGLNPAQSISLEQVILSGPENNESGEHAHELSVE